MTYFVTDTARRNHWMPLDESLPEASTFKAKAVQARDDGGEEADADTDEPQVGWYLEALAV